MSTHIKRVYITKKAPVKPENPVEVTPRWHWTGGSTTTITAPNGRIKLIFHSCDEWHMGAYGWKISILDNGVDVTHDHPQLQSLTGTRGYALDRQPILWNPDNTQVILTTWQFPGVFVYDLQQHRLVIGDNPIFEQCIEAYWSPAYDRLLFFSWQEGIVTDMSGQVLTRIQWRSHPFTNPNYAYKSASWASRGANIASWIRVPNETLAYLDLFDSESGNHLETCPLDADQYLPEPLDRMISRIHDQMRASGITQDINYILDTMKHIWGTALTALYDESSNTLYLTLQYPAGMPQITFVEDDHVGVRIKDIERYLAVEFTE
jgi:hypothetical protein